jgi:hypothetical protein
MPRITRRIEEIAVTTAQDSTFTAEAERLYKLDLTSSDITVHLPTASGEGGKDIVLAVVSSGANHATVVPSGSETVGEINQLRLETYDSMILTSDDVDNWIPVGAPIVTTAQEHRTAFGHLYISTMVTTAVTGGAGYVKANGTTTLIAGNYFDMPANNRLRYTDAHTKQFSVDLDGAASINAANSLLYAAVYKNGVFVTGAEIDRHIATVNDHGAFGLNTVVTLSTNDYLEIYIKCDNSGNYDLDHAMLRVTELMEI